MDVLSLLTGAAELDGGYLDGRRTAEIEVHANSSATVVVPLPPREPGEVVEVYLPDRYEPAIHDIRAAGGDIAAAPQRARWVAYGDSITQGWTVTHPSAAWPALAAREAGLDLVNLGFAGAARSELPVAAYLASLPADVITFSRGTNCWAQIEMDASYIAELMRMFLATVRRGIRTPPSWCSRRSCGRRPRLSRMPPDRRCRTFVARSRTLSPRIATAIMTRTFICCRARDSFPGRRWSTACTPTTTATRLWGPPLPANSQGSSRGRWQTRCARPSPVSRRRAAWRAHPS